MRFEPTVFLSLFGATAAHYTFNSLILNGQITPQWQYVRRHNRGIDPTRGVDRANVASVHFRCNLDALSAGPSTQVAAVSPGQRIGFKSYYGEIEHPGPLLIYMSKAPGNVQNYDGSGDWFKVHEEYVCGDLSNGLQDTDWCIWDRNEFFFTIPQQTPPGDYLVRVEHIALHGAWGNPNAPEFYMACAQIRVSGSGSGSPGPLVKIPGAYNLDDPAFRFNIYNSPRDYPYKIGPPVWNGGGSSGSTTSSSPSSTSNPGGCSAMYGQCGGRGWTGPTCCSQGTCRVSNEYYSQCL